MDNLKLHVKRTPSPPPTPLESVAFIRQMLSEMRAQAVEIDWHLAYLLEMSALHANDLLSGRTAIQKSRIR